ncbi:ferritin [Brevundimonas sp. LM2]|uniref:ferritin family protein n=1 Tax=Brevundimonas sp. LM2 TaxID=1938605 RepID=UPI000984037C|nr:ferritin family protein [Brevundimonas sp. LM2]AQR61004.1 ferritin [Brevundimonas sp. LM2]
MSSEGLHVSRDRLTRATLHVHHAITSLKEELEAVDWYRQRAEDCEDPELNRILLHNAREEIEHACMVLEWLRQNDAEFADQMKKYLFKTGSVTDTEAAVMGRAEAEAEAHPG